MKLYYLAPKEWNSDSYRDVYNLDQIEALDDDWCSGTSDCEELGYFASELEAIDYAKENGFGHDMR
jgi:hypothetical protein